MANPLFNLLGSAPSMMPGPIGNMMNLLGQLNQFRSQIKGDPKQQIQELLNSGKMTQSQFNQCKSMAEQIQKMIK